MASGVALLRVCWGGGAAPAGGSDTRKTRCPGMVPASEPGFRGQRGVIVPRGGEPAFSPHRAPPQVTAATSLLSQDCSGSASSRSSPSPSVLFLRLQRVPV